MIFLDLRSHAQPPACVRCGCPSLGGVAFPELEGAPLLCTRCWFQALAGEPTPRAWSLSPPPEEP
jgi:hypothetical protein